MKLLAHSLTMYCMTSQYQGLIFSKMHTIPFLGGRVLLFWQNQQHEECYFRYGKDFCVPVEVNKRIFHLFKLLHGVVLNKGTG